MSGSTSSDHPPRRSRPAQPWLPAKVGVWGVYKRTRTATVRNARTGQRERRQATVYDVRFQVDGFEFRYGLEQKGWADDFARQLREGFAKGWLFDPQARRFLPMDTRGEAGEAESVTSYQHVTDYFVRRWHHWAPSTRSDSQRALSLACIFLVRDEAPVLDTEQRQAADRFLRQAVLIVPRPERLSDDQGEWAA